MLDAAALIAYVPATATTGRSGGARREPVSVPMPVPQRMTVTDALLRVTIDLDKSMLLMMAMVTIAAVPRVCAVVVLRLQTDQVAAAAVYLRVVARVLEILVVATHLTIAAVPTTTEHAMLGIFWSESLLFRTSLVDKGWIILKPPGSDTPQASS